jgi:hypothetical protein
MPRTILTPAVQPSAYADTLVALTPVAADTVNQNRVLMSGREDVVAWNNGATPRTVTVTSAPDSQGRTNHIAAFPIAAGEFLLLPRIGVAEFEGWRQADGYLYLEASHADVKFLVWRQPK